MLLIYPRESRTRTYTTLSATHIIAIIRSCFYSYVQNYYQHRRYTTKPLANSNYDQSNNSNIDGAFCRQIHILKEGKFIRAS